MDAQRHAVEARRPDQRAGAVERRIVKADRDVAAGGHDVHVGAGDDNLVVCRQVVDADIGRHSRRRHEAALVVRARHVDVAHDIERALNRQRRRRRNGRIVQV